MTIVKTSALTERNFIVDIASESYDFLFEEKELVVPEGGYEAGLVLNGSLTALTADDTTFGGIVADQVEEGTSYVRVMTSGPVTVREAGLSFDADVDAPAQAAAFAAMEALLIKRIDY